MADAYASLGDVVSTAPQGSDPYAAMGDVQSGPSGRPANFDGVYFKDLGDVQALQATYPKDSPEAKMAPEDFALHYGQTRSAPLPVMIGDQVLQAPKSIGEQLGDATKNDVAGIAQGITAIPDAATHFVAGLGQLGAKAVEGAGSLINDVAPGYGDGLVNAGNFVDQNLAKPVTLGGMIESAAPTPQDTTGKVARIVSQLAGGAVSIPGLTTVPNALMPQVPKIASQLPSQVQTVANAAKQEGVQVLPADVGGGFTRRMTSFFAQTPLGAGPIAKGAQRTISSFAARRNTLASNTGAVTDMEGAGEAAQRGANAYIKSSGSKASKMFDRALKPVNPNVPVVVDQTIAATRRTLDTLRSTPEIAEILQSPALKKFGAALESDAAPGNGSIPLEAARKLRTAVGQAMENRSLTDDLKAADLKRVYSALSQDIERAVDVASKTGAAPKGTLARLRAANKYYQTRMDRIENVLSSVLGKDGQKNPQAAFEAIQRMAAQKGGDSRKLAALMQSLPDDEAASIRATIISKLGESSPRSQNATRTAFSASEFLSHWLLMSDRAKATLFSGSLRRSLDNLATIAEGSKAAAKYAGHSNTGAIYMADQSIKAVGTVANTVLAAGGGTGAVTHHPIEAALAFAALAGQYVGAKFFASPVAVRQLVRISSARTPSQARDLIRSLSTVTASDHTLAPSIPQLQQKLMDAVRGNMHAAAALGDNEQQQ